MDDGRLVEIHMKKTFKETKQALLSTKSWTHTWFSSFLVKAKKKGQKFLNYFEKFCYVYLPYYPENIIFKKKKKIKIFHRYD